MCKDFIYRDTKNNGRLKVREIPYELAKEITINNHYSGKWGSAFGIVNYGIFQDDNPECLGVAVFGNLMNPNSYKSVCEDLEAGQIIELNRLWLDDILGMNAETSFLAMCFRLLRRDYPHIKLVQSFADGRLGCGTIYKAANFLYYGHSETLFFEHESGWVQHKVPFENTGRLATMISLNLLLALGEFRPFTVKTYRYIFPLDRRYIKRIKLKEHPYPEYDIGVNYIDDYVQGIGPMARAFMAFHYAGRINERDAIRGYIDEHYPGMNFDAIRETARSRTMDRYIDNEEYAREYIKERYEARLRQHPNEDRSEYLEELNKE